MRRALALVLLTACGGAERAAAVPPWSPIPVEPQEEESAGEHGFAPRSDSPPKHVVTIVDGCPDDMVPIGGYCIDRYEAPNE